MTIKSTFPRQKLREIAFQFLYSHTFLKEAVEELVPILMRELKISKTVALEAKRIAGAVELHLGEIDEALTGVSKEWKLDRIQSVELAILRLIFFEIFIVKSAPPKVGISEAVRLCRKFSTPESAKFANAILDGLYKKSIGQELDKEALLEATTEYEQRRTTPPTEG